MRKNFEEIIFENFPNMEKEIVNWVQEAQSPIQDKPKEKHAKTQTNQTNKDYTQRILKAAREKQQVTYKGNPIWLTAELSAEIQQARREWQDIFKVLKRKHLQPDYSTWQGSHSKNGGETKSFTVKQKLREFSTTKPALQQALKGLL